MPRRFQQVDVFATGPLSGNPVAVVLDAEGLPDEQMQRLARWTNLSETTFLLPPTRPGADYRVRIFSPPRELPFAGHPTLGSCHAWLEAGGRPRTPGLVVQECAAGLVPVRRTEAGLAFAAPPLVRSGPVDDPYVRRVAAVLGIARDEIVEARWADNGPGWVAVLLRDAAAVLALRPDVSRDPGEGVLDIGVVGAHPAGAPEAFEVRALFTDDQGVLREDPVTGSLNASLAEWLIRSGRARAPFRTRQGTRLGRHGRVHVERDADGTLWIGGATHGRVRGEIDL